MILSDKWILAAKIESKMWILKYSLYNILEANPSETGNNVCFWEGNEKAGKQMLEYLFFTAYLKVSFEFYSSKILWVTEPFLTQRQELLGVWNRINEHNLLSFRKILWDDAEAISLAFFVTQRNQLAFVLNYHMTRIQLHVIEAQLFPADDSAIVYLPEDLALLNPLSHCLTLCSLPFFKVLD